LEDSFSLGDVKLSVDVGRGLLVVGSGLIEEDEASLVELVPKV